MKSSITLIEYEDRYQPIFRSLNLEWLDGGVDEGHGHLRWRGWVNRWNGVWDPVSIYAID